MSTEKQTQESEQKQQIDMEKTLEEVKDPELKKVLTGILERVKHSDIYKEVREIKKKIINAPKRPEQLLFAFIPHEMAKVSIFFPMSDKELKEERRLIQKIEHESSWGKITVEGVKLAIFEEDIFLTLMTIAKKKMKFVDGQYLLEINMKEIIHLLYGTSGYSTKKAIDLIIRSLDHFQLVKFTITLFDKKNEFKKEGLRGSIGNIVQSHYYDPETQSLKIKFNPDFCVFFLESMLTNINFTIRRSLKRDGSKALLRFLSTHTQPGRMHILTVLNAINYNTNQPMFRLRSKIKQFIAELKKNGVLGLKTKLSNDDTVCFEILPPKKAIHD
jgi:hypothetical protein